MSSFKFISNFQHRRWPDIRQSHRLNPKNHIFNFHFFFKPLSVTLPSPRASTDRETTRRARKRIQYRAEAGSVTAAEGQGGDAGAIFAPASIVGALSDGCAAMAG